MRKIVLSASVFLLLLTLFGCLRSKKGLTEACEAYLNKKYKFSYEIIKTAEQTIKDFQPRWGAFHVTTIKDGEVIDFYVDVKGTFYGTIAGDDYKEQEKAAALAKVFRKKNATFLEENKFAHFKMSAGRDGLNSVQVEQAYLSLNSDSSLQRIILLHNLLKESNIPVYVMNVSVTSLNNHEFPIYFNEAANTEQLKKELLSYNFAFYAQFEKDKPVFEQLQIEMDKLGYYYFYGQEINMLAVNSSVDKESEGYGLTLRGNFDRVTELLKLLRSQPVNIRKVIVFDANPNDKHIETRIILSIDLSEFSTDDEIQKEIERQKDRKIKRFDNSAI